MSFKDASGNINPAKTFIIEKMSIGNYDIYDVVCAANPSTTTQFPSLLGMSALRKLGNSIEIDFNKNILIVK